MAVIDAPGNTADGWCRRTDTVFKGGGATPVDLY